MRENEEWKTVRKRKLIERWITDLQNLTGDTGNSSHRPSDSFSIFNSMFLDSI